MSKAALKSASKRNPKAAVLPIRLAEQKSSQGGAPVVDAKNPFVAPPSVLTQEGPMGIRYDFNEGCRVTLPEGKNWRVYLRDIGTGNILFQTTMTGGGTEQQKIFCSFFHRGVRGRKRSVSPRA
jgi:hypothetical protein